MSFRARRAGGRRGRMSSPPARRATSKSAGSRRNRRRCRCTSPRSARPAGICRNMAGASRPTTCTIRGTTGSTGSSSWRPEATIRYPSPRTCSGVHRAAKQLGNGCAVRWMPEQVRHDELRRQLNLNPPRMIDSTDNYVFTPPRASSPLTRAMPQFSKARMATLPNIANNEDVRFLGRLLGDVIRDHGGEALFRRTEYIRAASVDRHRGIGGEDSVDLGLDRLPLDETLDFVRGVMLFSMRANLAEDRQGVAAEQGATGEAVLERLAGEDIGHDRVLKLLDRALIVPVLTAHPTEVRRKSMIDHRNRIAELMTLRDAGRSETPAGDLVEAALLRQKAQLWQPRVLRRARLYVADEVETALSYLRDVFVPALPALCPRRDRALGARVTAFLRPGSWIGGDRDGDPVVTAASLATALAQASEAVLGAERMDAVEIGAEH